MASYSAIIKNGTILDGTGEKSRYQTDVGIANGKIHKIGNLENTNADILIDASNLYVAPGFIDLTTHSDTHWTLFLEPSQENFIRQGVTTIVGGHGGNSLAPFIQKDSLEAMGKWFDISKVNFNWQTFAEFTAELRKHKLGVNFASFVGHENLRRNILSGEARPASKKETKEMISLMEEALKNGAFGLSTNLGTPQTREIPNEEITELFKIAKKYNVLTTHHLEDEGKNLLPAISRLVMLLRASGAAGHISHFKALGKTAWENFGNALLMIEMAQKDGLNLTLDFFPYDRTGSALVSLLPPWVLSKDKSETLKMLKEPKIKKDLTEYFKSLTFHYEKIIIASTLRTPTSTGKSIKEISESTELSPEEVILDLLGVNELQVSIFNEVISPKHLETLCAKTYSAVASDGVGYSRKEAVSPKTKQKDLPHPRSYGTFPRIFSSYVRENPILTWEKAVHKMSGLPAQILQMKKRGILKEGNFADITVFDPNRVMDRATYSNPMQYPEGIAHVFINGKLALSDGVIKEGDAGEIILKD